MLESDFTVSTKRLVVRFLNIDDYDIWKQTYLKLSPAKNKWDRDALDESQLTKTAFKKNLSQQKSHRKIDIFYDFVAFDKFSGAIIGYASLMDITRNVFQNAYLGYGIFNSYWGKGYGKEMTSAVINLAFTKLNLHRVEAGIDPKNKRSIALAKSIGLRREGLSKKRLYLGGQWKDMSIYAMTSEEKGLTGPICSFVPNRRWRK